MLAVISPAKTLDFASAPPAVATTEPQFMAEAAILAGVMASKKPAQLQKLMGISVDLARLNHARFQTWSATPVPSAVRTALFAFKGDVYLGLDAPSLTARDIDYAQSHLRILSGLYGLLRPLDLIQPYRLEMGTSVKYRRARILYDYWGATPAQALAAQAANLRTRMLVNLASQEYFRAVDVDALGLDIITPVFKDWSRGQYRVVSFFAKRARGMMVRHMLERRSRKREDLLDFSGGGYAYDAARSTPAAPVFLRRDGALE